MFKYIPLILIIWVVILLISPQLCFQDQEKIQVFKNVIYCLWIFWTAFLIIFHKLLDQSLFVSLTSVLISIVLMMVIWFGYFLPFQNECLRDGVFLSIICLAIIGVLVIYIFSSIIFKILKFIVSCYHSSQKSIETDDNLV